MKEKLKEFLNKENSSLLHEFKWGNEGANNFFEFMNLVREELNFKQEFNFIRMINKHTGEVKEADASMKGFNALRRIIKDDADWYSKFELDRKYVDDIKFEGNEDFINMLNTFLLTLK